MAATLAYFLAREDPDMYRLMQLPGDGLVIPHQVIPIKWVSFVSSVHSVFSDFIRYYNCPCLIIFTLLLPVLLEGDM
jgi:hypothetical protein